VSRKRRYILWLAVLSTLLVVNAAPAQVKYTPQHARFQMAQQYERMGELERALNIYLSLYRSNPANFTYFDAVSRCYALLKRYDELIALIQERLRAQPGNIQYQVRLGDAYLRKGDEQKAFQIFDDILRKNRKNISVYRLVANELLQNRLYDRSIEVYRRGRKALGRPDLFALELAQLHTYRLNYADATEEYLRFLRANPRQLAYVQARLAQFSGEHTTYEQVTRVLRRWIRKEPKNRAFRKLLISTLISFGDFEGAFTEVQALEKANARSKSREVPGRELFRFGQTCYSEGKYHLAEQAFTRLLRDFPGYRNKGSVLFELAKTLTKQGKYRQALQLFRRVERQFPRSSLALRSYLSCGQIFLDQLFEPDSAASYYQQILFEFKRPDEQTQALLALGDVEVARGNLDQAEHYYKQALQLPLNNAHRDYRKRLQAHLRLAEVAFYKKDFAAAQQHLQSILQSPSGNLSNELVNDALEFSLVIENNLDANRVALESYADALYLVKRRRWKEAVQAFQVLADRFPQSSVAPKALFEAGRLKERLGDYLGAVLLYQSLLNQYPQHTLCDLALWRMGQIYENELNDPAKATDQYMAILVKYPESMFVEKARKRIRALEGKP